MSVPLSAPPSAPSPSVARTESAQRVLDTALELFSQHGYDGTSLQLIADRLGVTKAAVYYHFHTKEEILAALVQPAFAELEQLVTDSASSSSATARRDRGLAGYIDYLLRHRSLSRFLSQDISALSRPMVWEPAQALDHRIESLLTGEADSDLARVWGSAMMRGLIAALLSNPDASEPWLRAELAEIGRHMIAGYRKAQRREAAGEPRVAAAGQSASARR